MSSGKLDQGLDDIIKTSRNSRGGRGGRRSAPPRNASKQAPVGGVQKATKSAKPVKTAPAPQVGPTGDAKIMISNLPLDVDQTQLQDYFASLAVGKPKRVIMQYGPNGRSLGSATVIFHKHDQAVKATNALDKVKIDNKPVRVEMLLSAANIPTPAPQPSLADRVSKPKADKPKPATTKKPASTQARGQGRARARGRGGRDARGKKKTIEELDAEMADYFPQTEGGNDPMATNGDAAQATATGTDTNMDDEML